MRVSDGANSGQLSEPNVQQKRDKIPRREQHKSALFFRKLITNNGTRCLRSYFAKHLIQNTGLHKKSGNLKNPTKIEEIQENQFIDRN